MKTINIKTDNIKTVNIKTIIMKNLVVFLMLFSISCSPIKEFHRIAVYDREDSLKHQKPIYDPDKQTVFIVASNNGTEIFDLMAPYEIFAATKKLNVFVVAPEIKPLLLWKGLFLLPHYSLQEITKASIRPDLIVRAKPGGL